MGLRTSRAGCDSPPDIYHRVRETEDRPSHHSCLRQRCLVFRPLAGINSAGCIAGEDHVSARTLLCRQSGRVAVAIDVVPFLVIDDHVGETVTRRVRGPELSEIWVLRQPDQLREAGNLVSSDAQIAAAYENLFIAASKGVATPASGPGVRNVPSAREAPTPRLRFSPTR